MLWDTHMHTAFSGDSDAAPESMIDAALACGLPGICITDHEDLDYAPEPGLFTLPLTAYMQKLGTLKEQYRGRIPVLRGIELGLQPHLADTHARILAEYGFDFVIGSSHLVHGMDPWYPEFYDGRTEEAAYREYFESILENIEAFDGFDVYGHLDYVVRYGPNRNAFYSYARYAEPIDAILTLLIAKGKGIEVNTAGFKYGLSHPNPTEDILRRYHELGGRILTIGADAHAPDQVAHSFYRIPELLRTCGFTEYTVFRNRIPQMIRLPE